MPPTTTTTTVFTLSPPDEVEAEDGGIACITWLLKCSPDGVKLYTKGLGGKTGELRDEGFPSLPSFGRISERVWRVGACVPEAWRVFVRRWAGRFERFPIVNEASVRRWLERIVDNDDEGRDEKRDGPLELLVNHLRTRWTMAGYATDLLSDSDVRRLWGGAPELLPDEFRDLLAGNVLSSSRTVLPTLVLCDPDARLRLVAYTDRLLGTLGMHELELGFPGVRMGCLPGDVLAEESNNRLGGDEEEGGGEEEDEEKGSKQRRSDLRCFDLCRKHVSNVVGGVSRLLEHIPPGSMRLDLIAQLLVRVAADRAQMVQPVLHWGGGKKTTTTTTKQKSQVGYRDVTRVSLRWSMMNALYQEARRRTTREPLAAIYVFMDYVAEEERMAGNNNNNANPMRMAGKPWGEGGGKKGYEDPLLALSRLSRVKVQLEHIHFKKGWSAANRLPPPREAAKRTKEMKMVDDEEKEEEKKKKKRARK